MKRIMILGADGYLGWPTSMYWAEKSEVIMVDNYVKRKINSKFRRSPLVRLKKIDKKLQYLRSHYHKDIFFHQTNCANYNEFKKVFVKYKPDVVIHFAELPSAPYSMAGVREGWYTLNNNLQSTYNLACLVKNYNKNCHIIKLGTMGEYGTPNIDIEEGWLKIKHKKRSDKFLYPRQASSLYHTSKIMDTDMLWFYVRLYGINVTDLMQGPVYGVYTQNDMSREKGFETSLMYDDIFGTVLNRFITQAVTEIPLTVYGSGSQTRGYINIIDTLKCINLAIQKPKSGLTIYNQFTEQFSVNELARKVQNALRKINIKVKIKKIKNPRIEKEKHYYNASNKGLRDIGLKASYLSDEIIIEIAQYILNNKKNINKKIIQPKVHW